MDVPVAYVDDFCTALTDFEVDYRIKGEHTVLTLENTSDHWTLLFGNEASDNKARRMLAAYRFCAGFVQPTQLLSRLRQHHGLFYRHKQVHLWSIECTTSGKGTHFKGTFAEVCREARAYRSFEAGIWLQPGNVKIAHLDQHDKIHMMDLCHVYCLTEAICSGEQAHAV
jgi:hypothetical protein